MLFRGVRHALLFEDRNDNMPGETLCIRLSCRRSRLGNQLQQNTPQRPHLLATHACDIFFVVVGLLIATASGVITPIFSGIVLALAALDGLLNRPEIFHFGEGCNKLGHTSVQNRNDIGAGP